MAITLHEIAKLLDHSTLQPFLTEEDIIKGCDIALQYNTATVCARPGDMPLVVKRLAGSDVLPCTVIGFPHGAHHMSVKCFEAEKALDDGCRELDMVLNIGKMLHGEEGYVEEEIRKLSEGEYRLLEERKQELEQKHREGKEKLSRCTAQMQDRVRDIGTLEGTIRLNNESLEEALLGYVPNEKLEQEISAELQRVSDRTLSERFRIKAEELEGQAEVLFPVENCQFAMYVFRYIHEWKANYNWGDDVDLVHWNTGLWDILHLLGDDVFTPPELYRELLQRIDKRIRLLFPKAKIVFALSTSVVEEKYGPQFYRKNAEIEQYNEIAREVFGK